MAQVILVNERDEAVGKAEKLAAHQQALLHRAISIFIFNQKGEMLLQQRAYKKYHSGGLWSNACCSHPEPEETIDGAATRRLQEELGFSTTLKKIFHFTYHAILENGLTENEFDHVFIGIYNDVIRPDADEVMDYCFMKISAIKDSILTHPQKYTEWFKIALPKVEAYLSENNNKNFIIE